MAAVGPIADVGLIGLAVMGQNLILNMNDHGFKVIAFNRDVTKVDKFLENQAKGLYFVFLIITYLYDLLQTLECSIIEIIHSKESFSYTRHGRRLVLLAVGVLRGIPLKLGVHL